MKKKEVRFYHRDFSGRLNVPVEITVERYSHHMEGGPYKATFSAPAGADRWELKKLLRCPVEIYGDNKAQPLWWGVVNRVTIPQGEQRFGYGLDNMYNHIQVRYGQEEITDAAIGTVSVSEYGQKELLVRSYDLTGLEAAQFRAVQLEDKADPKVEVDFSSGEEKIEIECIGWHETLSWKHYTNTTESNVDNTAQIETIVGDIGQFIQGVLIEDVAGVVSNQKRDARDGLSCINELLQSGTSNARPLLAKVDRNRYLHVWERSAKPSTAGDVDFTMRDDGRLETKAGGKLVPDELCTVAKWIQAKDSPVGFSFFIEFAEYNARDDKTTYRPAGSYDQRRLAKFIADVVTGDKNHVWPSLIPSGLDDPQLFEPFWVALGKDGDNITAVRGAAWDSTNNILYVTGQFTVIGGVAAVNFAKLDMATGQWYALNTTGAPGSTNYGWAAAIANSKVYFGTQGSGVGCFWEYDDATDTWTDLSDGTSGPCNTLEVDGTDVYLGGAFTSMPSSANSNYISKWNGASFDALGTGMDYTPAGTGGVYDMIIDSGILYAVGKFDDAGGESVVNVAAWDGASWAAVGGGLGSVGDSLAAVAAKNGYIYADNGLGNNYLCQWDGTQWTTIGIFNGGIQGLIISDDEQYLYVIGDFDTVDSLSVGNSTYWDGSAFYTMNDGLSGASITNADWALFDGLHPIAAGNFTLADGNPALGVAMYITTLQGLIDHLTNTGGVSRPGGPDQAIQYNADGRFGGVKQFLFDYTNKNFIFGGYTPPAPGTNAYHHILEGASPGHGLWAFTSSYAGFLKFFKANGDSETESALLADEVMGRIRAAGYDGSAWSATRAEIKFVTDENWSGAAHGTRIEIYETPAGTTAMVRYPYVWRKKTAAPTANDDSSAGYVVGDRWVDETNDKEYVCLDNTATAAVWTETTGAAAGWDGDIADIDIDGGTDIGAALADVDLIIVDDGAGGTNRKSALSRVWTYISGKFTSEPDYSDISGNDAATDVTGAELETLSDGSDAAGLHYHDWFPISSTWTRTGNHTFTVSGDVTSTYTKGAFIRYQDGGSDEYGVIESSSHAGGTTTVNLIPNSDYAMAAATITDNYISYIYPPDFPKSFNYAITWTSTGTNPAIVDGTLSGKWTPIKPGTILVKQITVMGASTTYGTGFYNWSIPVSPIDTSGLIAYESAAGNMLHAGYRYALAAFVRTNDMRGIYANNILTSTSPVTLTSGDDIRLSCIYDY